MTPKRLIRTLTTSASQKCSPPTPLGWALPWTSQSSTMKFSTLPRKPANWLRRCVHYFFRIDKRKLEVTYTGSCLGGHFFIRDNAQKMLLCKTVPLPVMFDFNAFLFFYFCAVANHSHGGKFPEGIPRGIWHSKIENAYNSSNQTGVGTQFFSLLLWNSKFTRQGLSFGKAG